MKASDAVDPEALRAVLDDLGGGVLATPGDAVERARALRDDERLVVAVPGTPDDADLARLRDALWPACHAVGLYRARGDGLVRETLEERAPVPGRLERYGAVVVARTRAFVLSPETTTEKFDANAAGWNGLPGTPGYAHFRWMRRYVARFAGPAPRGARVLDFGCGAGWVGIEAAKSIPEARLRFMDPSPEMVRIAEENARREGLTAEGRTGFGEAPPFEGEEFDLVISSGVLSFSPDLDGWIRGLAGTVKAGGTLVVGDLNPASRGMRRRRRAKPLLPVRELNAHTAGEIRGRLEALGFRHEETAGYQLTRPVPQAMHLSETRLKGIFSPPLLLLNRSMSAVDRAFGDGLASWFDSWVMRLRAFRTVP